MGSVVISVDAELGWGFHDLDTPPESRVEAGRTGWQALLDVLERYDVPATWAVVGHLFLADCDGVHADHPAPDGWFDRERGAWRNRPDLRFGADLIADTVESSVDHEIASHTFSHVLFDDDRTTREIATAEIEAATEAAEPYGIEYDSLIFPRNAVGYRDVLASYDVTCYRSKEPQADSQIRRNVDKLLSAVDPARADLVTPTVDEYGLVDVPPSLFLFGFEGMPRTVIESVWDDPIVRHAKHGIDRATREEGAFHLWLHPNNLQTDRDVERVRRIVAYAAQQRDTTPLTIETMADVATRTLESSADGGGPQSRPLGNVVSQDIYL